MFGGLQGSDVEARLQSSKRLSTQTAERPPKSDVWGKNEFDNMRINVRRENMKPAKDAFSKVFFELGRIFKFYVAIFETAGK